MSVTSGAIRNVSTISHLLHKGRDRRWAAMPAWSFINSEVLPCGYAAASSELKSCIWIAEKPIALIPPKRSSCFEYLCRVTCSGIPLLLYISGRRSDVPCIFWKCICSNKNTNLYFPTTSFLLLCPLVLLLSHTVFPQTKPAEIVLPFRIRS